MDFETRFLSLARQDLGTVCPLDVPSAAKAIWEKRSGQRNLLPFDRKISHPDEGYSDLPGCTLMYPARRAHGLSVWLCGQSPRELPGNNYPAVVGVVDGAARFVPLLPAHD